MLFVYADSFLLACNTEYGQNTATDEQNGKPQSKVTVIAGLRAFCPIAGICRNDSILTQMVCFRLKKTASLYLYKMFLEYRGRMPYTTINLTGYSIVTAMIKSEEKEHLTTVHIKLTSKRNTNQKDRTRLTWYVKREELQEAINAIVDGSLILESDDEYIELQGKGEIELSCGAASVILKKQIKDDMYTIDVNLKSIGEA